MDQIKTGKFIAERRLAQKLTQRQLADALSVSDKTISKWECGKGMPEVSLMLPLCEILQITVNDLLSGEIVSDRAYREKAEENLTDLLRKNNSENKKMFAVSVLCCAITFVAVCALVALAAFLNLPIAARIALLVLATAAGAAGVGAAIFLDLRVGYFECPHCKALFVPTAAEYVKGVHTLTRRRLTCPRCGKKSMCRRRIVVR